MGLYHIVEGIKRVPHLNFRCGMYRRLIWAVACDRSVNRDHLLTGRIFGYFKTNCASIGVITDNPVRSVALCPSANTARFYVTLALVYWAARQNQPNRQQYANQTHCQ
jgi:hypothetical protein